MHPSPFPPRRARRRPARATPTWRLAAAVAALAASPWPDWGVLPAQDGARPTPALGFRLGAVLAVGGPFVEDASGLRIAPVVSPVFELGVLRTLAPRTVLNVIGRGSRSALNAHQGGQSWSVGSVTQFDIAGAVEHVVARRGALRAGAGLVHVRGPRDVVPFREANRRPWRPMGEAGGSVQVLATRPLHGTATGQAFPFGDDSPGTKGAVWRVLLGLRYGR